jgi:Dynamin family
MNGLRAFQDHRLELGDMIRAALHLARGTADDQAEKRARELLARLAADRFQLAVVGQFSRGKTTLMNALLGGTYLPMGALPMTSVITTVRFGSRPRAIVHRRASPLPVEVPLPEVAGFVAQASTKRAELQVVSVQVEIPAEILRLGFEFVDTPGIGVGHRDQHRDHQAVPARCRRRHLRDPLRFAADPGRGPFPRRRGPARRQAVPRGQQARSGF